MMESTENYLPSLITGTPMEGRELAIKLARKSIAAIQTDGEVRKKLSLITICYLFINMTNAWACEVCKQNQPKPLQNITHGAGPQSDWDYVIIIAGIIIVSFTLFYSLKFLIRPGEKNPNHIKNLVVNEGSPVN